jgi:hypothetical protein
MALQVYGQGQSVSRTVPAPGSEVSNLTSVTIAFAKPVLGVHAEDLILNGSSGTNLVGSGAVYTFSFSPPTAGIVQASWNGGHNITDLSGNRLNDLGANDVWQYTLVDTIPPTLTNIFPLPGATLSHLTQVQVAFSEAVDGVNASALLINGQPAKQVSGAGAGPYAFIFDAPGPGTVRVGWNPAAAIHDLAALPNPFGGGSWSYTLHPGDFSGNVIINEFLADNVSTNGLRDEDGTLQDWIEVYNRGVAAVNLAGWSLSDDPELPDMWVFPAVTITPGQYLVVFASGKDRSPTNGGNLHVNFKLGNSGQYLGLFNANCPREVATQFLPAYPDQRADISYGLYNDVFCYLTNPSPMAANSGPASYSGMAVDPKASVSSGLFNRPFSLTLSTPTAGASIRYTLDGSEPTPNRGLLYSGAISVAGSPAQGVVNVRAVAFRSDLLCSRVVTHSYIFPNYVLLQPGNPAGFPDSWITETNDGAMAVVVPADYQMDPRIITNSAYAAMAAQGLTNLPTLSIVTEIDGLFSQDQGIYANPNPVEADRPLWERPAFAELILPDGSSGFRINAGLRIHGSTSRDPNWTRKHSFRLFFKDAYDGPLNYAMFPDSPTEKFHTLVLTAGFNVSWNDRFEQAGSQAQFVRDQFCSDLQLEMNHAASHGRFVHLYLNGLYWGLYDVHERPDDHFASTYYGGDNSEYDVVRNTQGYFEVIAGDDTAWSAMMALVNAGLSDDAQYDQIKQYLDIDSFIDYMIVNQYAGNTDWANHNWYALRQRAPGVGYEFISWDAEITLKDVNENVTGYNQSVSPTTIHSFLKNNAEYRLKFADHVQKQFFNGGPLFVDTNQPAVDPANPQRNRPAARYLKRIAEVSPGVVLESARWGDTVPTRASNPFNLNGDFLPELNRLTNSYFPQRSAVLIAQYQTQLLYPDAYGVGAPVFSQPGGNVPRGLSLTITAPRGTVYYTTNGSDPRVYGTGAVCPDALAYTGTPIILNSTTLVRARALSGANWSPLSEATFSVAQPLLPLRITEIMYLPTGGQTYQFVELENFGSTALDLTGCTVSGIGFTFPVGFTIDPGAVIVLASGLNPTAFSTRYPGVSVAAYFSGKLAKGGERVAVEDALGQAIVAVNYSNTNGWPVPTSGQSIEIIDPQGNPDDPANWRLSASSTGTPGVIPTAPTPATVLLNEVLARNAGALTNSGTFPAWIELANSGPSAASLAGWSLSNDSNPRKYLFSSGASVPAGGFLVVFCDTQTTAPGLHTGFPLNPSGDTVFLFDSHTNRVDAVSFGMQVPNLSIGRVGGYWQLNVPTANAANRLAATGAATNLVINEWLANSAPGQSDWLELYNPSSQPVPLTGLYLGTSNELFQITALSFLPPWGYLQLIADKLPGANHLDFKLPAAGGEIVLYDAFGQLINGITYGPQLDGISQGRLPDGSPNIVSFPGSASPGTTNFVVSSSGPRLNELMARNDSAVVNPWGRYSDWIELYNPTTGAVDLSGMSLSVNQSQPGQWVFPAGTTLAAGAYLVVWCDGSRDAATNSLAAFNTGQSLDGNSGGAYLFNSAGQVVDYVEYGFQISNQSIGRVGGSWRLLANPTPGAANAAAATLGAVTNLRFNEWMAEPSSGDDWLELYNLDPQPVDLSGLYLTDDPSLSGQTKFTVAPLSFISGHGWVLWDADGHPSNGRNHLNFQLGLWGESLRLYGKDLTLLDAVDFAVQQPGVSAGRLPDGGSSIVSFPTSSTPGGGNYLPLNSAAINEVLTHTDPPLEDAIELVNLTAAPLNIGGWYLSDSQSQPGKYRIPDGTVLAAGGYAVCYEYQFNPNPGMFPSFALDSAHGDTVYLSAVDAAGNLTGYRTGVEFGASENGVSFGRYTNSTGVEFVAQSQHTFGVDSPATLAQFRTSAGRANAYPKVGPIVINELMYHPVTPADTNLVENPDEEFVELYNFSSNSIALFDPNFPANTWHLSGGITFTFPTGAVMAARSYLLVVSFDPVANPATLSAFRTRFSVDASTVILGPFKGRLSDEGESIELYKPDPPSPAPDAGFVPLILVDRVNYGITEPWPEAAAGGGASLQRRVASNYGNDPLNWKAEPPTAGRTNQPAGLMPPVITSQPDDCVVAAGASVTLSVAAAGSTPVAYRWQCNGVDVPAATNTSLTLVDAQLANSGSYQAWVSNAAGTIYSRPAVLSVLAPPVITAQPFGLSANLGSTVTLRVAAMGSTPMLYQWYFNGEPLSGATNTSVTLSGVDSTQAGTYVAVVSNPAGVVSSQPATLIVAGVDSDGDGIPDAWMIQHFGHPTGQAADHSRAQDDADGDGMSNLQEYLAGTDPLDPQSNLKLHVQGLTAGISQPQFSFTAVGGINYTLQYCESLGSGIWHKLNDVPAAPTTRIVTLSDPAAASASARFYRVVTPIQP